MLTKVLHKSEKPFVAIIGGAKVSDKILIIENLLERATDIIIGGGMAYTFMESKRGGKIGNSLCEEDRLATALEILQKAKEKNVSIHLPEDSLLLINLMQMQILPLHPVMLYPMDGWDLT